MNKMAESILSFNQFSFQYNSLAEPTLHDICLDIYPGEKILIAGPSGSGKSTLAHCINGLIPFAHKGKISGDYTLKGRCPAEQSIFEISRSVGTILQDQDSQFIGLTVDEDVAFAFENDCVAPEEMKPRVARALSMVDMQEHMNQSPHELSGGQKQRVSLAGVMSMEVDILLFDEPLANLDPASGKHAMKLIEDIHRDSGKTIIIIEHRIEDVLEQPIDRIVVMAEGRIVAVGTPDEILSSNVMQENGLREPLYISALKYAGCELTPDAQPSSLEKLSNNEQVRQVLGEWIEVIDNSSTDKDNASLVELQDVRFAYGEGTEVIKGVSLKIGAGERIALLGNNGAGKTTLSQLLTGMVRPTSGDILFNGESIRQWSIRRRGEQIGYVMQNPNHMITQTMIRDEVGLALRIQGVPQAEITAKVEEVLRICGLYSYRDWPVSALSYGQKKRVTIASIMVTEPKLIIVDEPTAGQDLKHYTQFMNFLSRLALQGVSLLFITHDMHLALEYTERAAVLCNGEIIASGTTASVLTNTEIMNRANLKETSLSMLSRSTEVATPEALVRHFIQYEKQKKQVSEHE